MRRSDWLFATMWIVAMAFSAASLLAGAFGALPIQLGFAAFAVFVSSLNLTYCARRLAQGSEAGG